MYACLPGSRLTAAAIVCALVWAKIRLTACSEPTRMAEVRSELIFPSHLNTKPLAFGACVEVLPPGPRQKKSTKNKAKTRRGIDPDPSRCCPVVVHVEGTHMTLHVFASLCTDCCRHPPRAHVHPPRGTVWAMAVHRPTCRCRRQVVVEPAVAMAQVKQRGRPGIDAPQLLPALGCPL